MKTESFAGKAESAYGQNLSKPVAFSGTFEAFETYAEVEAAKELLSNDEVVKVVNTKRKMSAVNSARQSALDAAGIVKPTLEGNRDLQIAGIVKSLVAAGQSEDEARATAEALIPATA